MADHITLQVVGLRELGLALPRWGAEIEAEARRELEQEVAATLADMKASAPVGTTGNLRAGIKGNVEATGVNALLRSSARYAHLVEHGHGGPHKAPPHPSFVPAAIRGRQRFYGHLKHTLAKPVPELGSGTPEVVER